MGKFEQPIARCDLDVLEILREARRLIKAGWCQGATAKDAHGNAVDPASLTAAQFDPLGALERAVLNLFEGDGRYLVQNYYKGFYALAWNLHTHLAIAAWNDDLTRLKEHVLERFDLAMARSSVPPVPYTPKVAA